MRENIVLIGMPGSGKTSVGRLLAGMLGRTFLDLDQAVEESAGKTISAIFAEEGEEAFRRRETACARQAAARTGLVIATGGGAVLRQENMDALSATGVVVFLDRSVEEICGSDLSGRPLIGGNPDRVRALYDQRIGLYRRYAQFTVESHGRPEQIAREILDRLKGECHG